jgi:phage gp29-like protein
MNNKRILWTSPSTAIELAAMEQSSRPLADEIATRARCDYFSMLSSLPDPDIVLRRMGQGLHIYEEQLVDPHVAACFDRRKAGTKKKLWEIDKGSAKSKHAKFTEDVFKQRTLKLNQAIAEILDCPYYGYQPLEVTWAIVNGMTIPVKVQAKPPRWFSFGVKNELRLLTKSNYMGENLPEKKFLLAQFDPRYDNPYGKRIAARVFWYAVFKKNGLKWWVKFVEKFGIPFIIGKLPRGTETSESTDLLEKLSAMINDAVSIVPDDASVELLYAKESAGTVPQHYALIDFCDKSISKAFLGHSAAADSTPGKLGGENVSQGATDDIIQGDTDIVCQVFNDLIDWTIELNFGPDAVRPTFQLYDEEKVQTDLATRDKTLADTQQVKFTKKYFMKAYNFGEDDIVVAESTAPGSGADNPADPEPGPAAVKAIVPTGAAATELAEPPSISVLDRSPSGVEGSDQKDVDELLNSLSDDLLQKQIEGPLNPVIELINGAASYEEVLEKIARLFPKMDDSEFQKTLTKAMFLAEVDGRIKTQPVRKI